MLAARCVMGWIMWTVACLHLCSAVKAIQSYKVKSTDGTAQVPCHIRPLYPMPEDIRVTLLKGLHVTKKVCSSVVNLTKQKETSVPKESNVNCSAQVEVDAVEMTVSGLRDTDIYRCEIEILFPPPYIRLRGNVTLIHVLENSECSEQQAHMQIADSYEERDDEGKDKIAQVNVPVGILVILILLALFVIICFQIIQCKQGRREAVLPVSAAIPNTALSCKVIV